VLGSVVTNTIPVNDQENQVDKEDEWPCQICPKIERAWSLEDFGYDESTPQMKLARLSRRRLPSRVQRPQPKRPSSASTCPDDENEHFFSSGDDGSYVTNDNMAEPETDPFNNIDQNCQEGVPSSDASFYETLIDDLDDEAVSPSSTNSFSLGSITMEPVVFDPNEINPEVVTLD